LVCQQQNKTKLRQDLFFKTQEKSQTVTGLYVNTMYELHKNWFKRNKQISLNNARKVSGTGPLLHRALQMQYTIMAQSLDLHTCNTSLTHTHRDNFSLIFVKCFLPSPYKIKNHKYYILAVCRSHNLVCIMLAPFYFILFFFFFTNFPTARHTNWNLSTFCTSIIKH